MHDFVKRDNEICNVFTFTKFQIWLLTILIAINETDCG